MSADRIDDGGPAFPLERMTGTDGRSYPLWQPGMSLRDYFAAAAMTGLLARPALAATPDAYARAAYEAADAMIQQRNEIEKARAE